MLQDKEHPALLAYMLIFFLLLTIVSYLMLRNYRIDTIVNDDHSDFQIPSYQNLFGNNP